MAPKEHLAEIILQIIRVLLPGSAAVAAGQSVRRPRWVRCVGRPGRAAGRERSRKRWLWIVLYTPGAAWVKVLQMLRRGGGRVLPRERNPHQEDSHRCASPPAAPPAAPYLLGRFFGAPGVPVGPRGVRAGR